MSNYQITLKLSQLIIFFSLLNQFHLNIFELQKFFFDDIVIDDIKVFKK
jgi:hypothetical protein